MFTGADILQAASNALTRDSQKPDFAKERTPFEELMNKPVGFARQHSLTSTSEDTLRNHPEIGQPPERRIQNDQGAPSVEGPATVKDFLTLLNQAPKQQPQRNLAGPLPEDRVGILTKIGATLRELDVNNKALNAQIGTLKDTNAPAADMKSAQATALSQRLANQTELIRQANLEVVKVSDNPGLAKIYDQKLEAYKQGLVDMAKQLQKEGLKYKVPNDLLPGEPRLQPTQSTRTMFNLIEQWKPQLQVQNNGSNMGLGAVS